MTGPGPRRRAASGGSTTGSDDGAAAADRIDVDGDGDGDGDASVTTEVDEWVILQTNVRSSVRMLARSVCVGMTRATGERYTLRQLLTDAIEAHAARLARRYNRGEPWPADDRPLPPGRSTGR